MSQGKINADYGMKDFYKYYKKNSENPVPYSVFSELIKYTNKELSKKIIKEAFEFKLPYHLGTIMIKKRKMSFKNINRLKPDWSETLKLWKQDKEAKDNKQLIFHLNSHTDNFRAQWFYNKSFAKYKNKSAYAFVATRTNKRELAKEIKNNGITKYFE